MRIMVHHHFILPLDMAIIVDMPKRRPYNIVFDEHAYEHLNAIDAKYRPLILEMIEEQLSYEPNVQTRNRKALTEPSVFGVAWETRFGQPDNRFRVFNRVDEEAYAVYVLAILVKRNNVLYLGDREFTAGD